MIISVYWYDEAIIDKLRELTKDQRISIVPTSRLFRYIASLRDDNVILPLISLTRLGYSINVVGRQPMSSQGYKVRINSDSEIVELQSIPVTINYQMDVIARKRDDNDELTSELIFYFTNNPSMHVNILKSANLPHIFSIWYNPEVEDNSDIESHMSQGEYFRSTLTFSVPDARLWKTTTKKPYKIDKITLIGTTDFKDSSKDYMEESIIISDKGDNS